MDSTLSDEGDLVHENKYVGFNSTHMANMSHQVRGGASQRKKHDLESHVGIYSYFHYSKCHWFWLLHMVQRLR